MNISPMRTGLALGGLLGAFHLLWALAVASGVAQSLVDLVFWMHFMQLKIGIAPFDVGIAAVLVAATSLVGFLLGYGFAALWNGLHQDRAAGRPATAP